MEAVLVKNADRMMLTAASMDEGIALTFADGGTGLIPFRDLPEVAEGGGIAGLELPNPYEIVVHMAEGENIEIPWDFARHYCDESYRPRVEAIARQGRQSLGRRIRSARKRAGLTQEELAGRSAIGRVTLVRIENGEQSPRFDTLSNIACTLAVKVEDLLA